MIDDILGIPDQLRDALWRIESARLQPAEAAGVFVCGMGGSAIGGDLAAAVVGDRLVRPVVSVRGYELPSWASADWTVLCSSYSGETEETLACFEAAGVLGARRVVLSTGGTLVDRAREAGVPVIAPPGIYQPRQAVAYMFVAAAEVAALAGVGPRLHTEIDAAAAFLSEEVERLRFRAAEVASELGDATTVVYGADLTAPVAHRWKTQLNENAKLPAFFSELPEADHNEVCGWSDGASGRLAAVFLEDRDQHPRERRRFDLTAELAAEAARTVVRIESAGETRAERLLWTVMLGDLVSFEVARENGVDPGQIDALNRIKEGMAR
jgi:glucose/mannose-6-phosphate isomerase